MTKPAALRKGDRVGVVSPAGPVSPEDLDRGCQVLHKLGYEPVLGDSVLACDGYFAGTAAARARDLLTMFTRPDVRAIICARGGYGTNYLLQELEHFDLLADARIFVGYSDVTTLLTRFVDRGLVCFHGPMVVRDFAQLRHDEASWRAALEGKRLELSLGYERDGVKTLVRGAARGVLYGGCLSLLTASLGTPYEIQTDGKILFIEDISAFPYQIDRMIMQLKLAGKFDGVQALMFGEMLACGSSSAPPTTPDVLARFAAELGVPAIFGLRSGHVTRGHITLPMGVEAEVEFTAEWANIRCQPAVIQD